MPSKAQFEAYCKVQQSGKFNMLMNANDAAHEAGLDLETYLAIVANYSELKKMYFPSCA